jgi:hypothetical protein
VQGTQAAMGDHASGSSFRRRRADGRVRSANTDRARAQRRLRLSAFEKAVFATRALSSSSAAVNIGSKTYLDALPKAMIHWLNSGHFAVEDSLGEIATKMAVFYDGRAK